MFKQFVKILPVFIGTTLFPISVQADEPILAPVASPSDLTVKVEFVDNVSAGGNLGTPIPYGLKELFIVDQGEGKISSYCTRENVNKCPSPDRITEIFNTSMAPAGITIDPAITSPTKVVNIAGNRITNKVYIAVTSVTVPSGTPVKHLPFPNEPGGAREDFLFIDTFPVGNGGSGPLLDQDIYRIDAQNFTFFGQPMAVRTAYQVIIEYKYKNGVLSDPRPIVALESQAGPGHPGGAMTIAPTGDIVFVTGDMLPFGMEGRAGAQIDSALPSKILLIDRHTGDVEVAAKGCRNVQQLHKTYFPFGLAFADIGGVTSEELNFVSWSDLLDTSEVENFGWGRNADGKAREGTYYVGPGQAFVLGTEPGAVGIAPVPEPGFEQPVAQYGRSALSMFNFVAATGPVLSRISFDEITAVFGDLANGELYGITSKINQQNQEAFLLNLVDENLAPLGPNNSLNDLAGARVDPRFFRFPNGTAGVLLEATGDIYRLTEVKQD